MIHRGKDCSKEYSTKGVTTEIMSCLAKYPTKLDVENLSKEEYRKLRTLELYDYLPQAHVTDDMTPKEKEEEIERVLAERFKQTDIRDEIIELNYTFFGFIATHTFINNSSISYEDKFQSAVCHFLEMWPKYRFTPKYRADLSFGVFFKPRVGECIERELNEVKYSLRRTLCMKVGDQLGKHWGQVTYDDLKLVNLPPDEMASLQAMFGSMYVADLDTHAMFIQADRIDTEELQAYSDNYDTLTDLLIHEMVMSEEKLTDDVLLNLAVMLDLPFERLKALLPQAEKKLRSQIEYKLEVKDTFEY